MRRLVLAVLLLAAAAPLAAQQQAFRLTGFLSGRGVYVTGPRSWLAGGFGRLGVGADGTHDHRDELLATAQLGVDLAPVSWFDAHVSGIARREQSGAGGRRGGLTEAYVDLRAGADGANELQLRAGQFFLPTSRENVDDLWTSPYTITWSALNTWIGEELRPIGADLQWKHLGSAAVYTVAATAFEGNDTMGTLLAWRGWSLGNRLSVTNESLPLPPLFSLHDPNLFGARQRGGTTPVGRDLDHRIGYSGRVRVSFPERGMIQLLHLDNRGDRELYRGEYSWITKLNLVSAQVGSEDHTVVAAEYGSGSTGMGFHTSPAFVDMNYYAGYFLVSHKSGSMRYSARYDVFQTADRDHSRAESNDEHGRAWTFAAFYEPTAKLRTGIEFVQVTGDRRAAAESGFDPNMDAHTLTAEVRYRF